MGCGTGNLTLKERHLFNNVVGLDISKSMIKKLKNKIHNNSNIELLISDCENLPIKTGCVNFVTMFSVLHHIPNIYVALKDAHRVLAQSGALFIDHEPNDHRLIRKILVYINKKIFNIKTTENVLKLDYSKSDIHVEKGFNRINLINMLNDIGYENVNIGYHNLLPYPPPININKKFYILIWMFMDNMPIIKNLADSLTLKAFKSG